MRVIELLLSNIYWVIVIVGFLFTMLQRSKAAQKNGRPKASPRMPTFGGGPDDREPGGWLPGGRKPSMSEGRPAHAEPAREAERPSSLSAASAAQTASAPLERAPLERAPLVAPLLERGTRAQTPAAHEVREMAAPLEADAESVRQGVMWAEILGPPRARKPYSYRK